MTRMFLALVVASVASLSGCGRGQPATATPPPTKVEHFKSTQMSTQTPHGRIVIESVTETPGGVRYKTADGETHQVDMVPKPDGGYRLTNYRHIE